MTIRPNAFVAMLFVLWTAAAAKAQPAVNLSAPGDRNSICASSVAIAGTLTWGAGFTSYNERYEYRAVGTDAWTIIQTFTTSPSASSPFTGTLLTWSIPAALADGEYYLRATLTTNTGTGTDMTSFRLNRSSAPTIALAALGDGLRVDGFVDIDGQITGADGSPPTTFEYRAAGAPAFSPITGTAPVGSLARWTVGALPDGPYDIRITARNPCRSTVRTVSVVVDRTFPVAVITRPNTCTRQGGAVPIFGTVQDAGGIFNWSLEYSGGGGFGVIASGTNLVATDTLLGTWNTSGLAPCFYTVSLRVTDRAGLVGASNINVDLACPADFNRNGSATVQDIFDYLFFYFSGCPL